MTETPPLSDILTIDQVGLDLLCGLFARFGLMIQRVGEGAEIPGSFFGAPEAGLIGRTILVRGDTPLHSLFHEGCHLICMDPGRRATLHTDAGGDFDEENGVNYLQILLADELDGVGRGRMMADMDAWGYTFRLGSARAWFEGDAQDARAWLLREGLIADLMGVKARPTWRLRGEGLP